MQKRLVSKEYKRLLRLYEISIEDTPILFFVTLKKSLGRYFSKKKFHIAQIKIDLQASGNHAVKVLRHEFAHFLQEMRGARFVERKAFQFERNVKSNVPYPPLKKDGWKQKQLGDF